MYEVNCIQPQVNVVSWLCVVCMILRWLVWVHARIYVAFCGNRIMSLGTGTSSHVTIWLQD